MKPEGKGGAQKKETVKIKNCEEVPKSDKLLKFTLNDGSGEDRVILSGITLTEDQAIKMTKSLVERYRTRVQEHATPMRDDYAR